MIAGGSALSSQFIVVAGASVAAAAIARSADRRAAVRPAHMKSGGISKLGRTLALAFFGRPVVAGSLILIKSGGIANERLYAVVLGSVVATLLIFVDAQATAKIIKPLCENRTVPHRAPGEQPI